MVLFIPENSELRNLVQATSYGTDKGKIQIQIQISGTPWDLASY